MYIHIYIYNIHILLLYTQTFSVPHASKLLVGFRPGVSLPALTAMQVYTYANCKWILDQRKFR